MCVCVCVRISMQMPDNAIPFMRNSLGITSIRELRRATRNFRYCEFPPFPFSFTMQNADKYAQSDAVAQTQRRQSDAPAQRALFLLIPTVGTATCSTKRRELAPLCLALSLPPSLCTTICCCCCLSAVSSAICKGLGSCHCSLSPRPAHAFIYCLLPSCRRRS